MTTLEQQVVNQQRAVLMAERLFGMNSTQWKRQVHILRALHRKLDNHTN